MSKKEIKTFVKKFTTKKIIIIVASLTLINIVAAYMVSSILISNGVKENCLVAEKKYQTDCVDGLIKTLNDETNDFKTRNNAIWALGRIGDKKALPVLEKYYNGKIPVREPINQEISQYELKKSINLLKGEFNLFRIIYR